jgi:hypothetical protein
MLGYYSGDTFIQTSFYQEHTDFHANLVCPGPSLKDIDVDKLHGTGLFVMALNTAYPTVKRPDMFLGMDSPSCYEPDLYWQSFTKITGGLFTDAVLFNKKIRDCKNTYFLAGDTEATIEDMFKNEIDTKFYWHKCSMFLALHFLLYMGFKRINLVGVDLGGDSDYHDGRTLEPYQKKINKEKYQETYDNLVKFAELAKEKGIEVISCSKNSKANDFLEYRSVEQCQKEAEETMPKPYWENRIHGGDAYMSSWLNPEHKVEAEYGVVTIVAREQSNLLPWWWNNYCKHNTKPVTFILLEPIPEVITLAETLGSVKVMNKVTEKINGWFRKPFALVRTPYRKTLYIELDIEVRGCIDTMFPQDERIYIKEDTFAPKCWLPKEIREIPQMNAGLIGYNYSEPLIEEWCHGIVASKKRYRGDQEYLNMAIHYTNAYDRVDRYLPVHCRLRLEGEGECIMKHHTGPEGKEDICRQMGVL